MNNVSREASRYFRGKEVNLTANIDELELTVR